MPHPHFIVKCMHLFYLVHGPARRAGGFPRLSWPRCQLLDETVDMSIYSSNRKTRKQARSQQGHLRLSACEESSALVVHIYEGRGLIRKDASVLDVYIKLYLLPDANKSTKKKTKTVKAQDPVFNQKFIFLLAESDGEKKLFISAWTPHLTSRNVMIGCMTFPVSTLVGLGPGLSGWFQLLDGERGFTDNQPVAPSISPSVTNSQQPHRNGEIAVSLMRGGNNIYGFEVRGHNPVYISHIVQDSGAQQAEVQVGDVVARVNDTDVRRANADLVRSIIMKSGDNLQLILMRDVRRTKTPPPSSSSSSWFSSPTRDTNTLPRSHRYTTPSPSHTATLNKHPPLSSSASYRTLSQDHLPLIGTRSSHLYSSLSYLPRGGRYISSPRSYDGGTSVLSQPPEITNFDPEPQDQFVHEAASARHSSFAPQTSLSHMGSVYEEREEEEEAMEVDEVERQGEQGREEAVDGGRWAQMTRPYPSHRVRHSRGGGGGGGGGGWRNRQSSGGELTQHPTHQHHYPHLPPPSFSFSQPGAPEVKTTTRASQADHAQNHTQNHTHLHHRKRVDVMTGEHRQFRGPSHSFSPNNPSHHHHRHHREHRHHSNVELIGHQPLRHTRSHGSGTEFRNDAVGMGGHYSRPSGGMRSSPVEHGTLEWEGLSLAQQKRQKVLQSLVETESMFHSVLKNGIETYQDPLQSVVSETVHSALFFNLKELFAVTSRVCLQLRQRQVEWMEGSSEEATPHYITYVADIYHAELAELVTLLRGYLDNLHCAKEELSISFTNEAFAHLVQQSVIERKNRSIYSFIEAGRDYTVKLFKCLLGTYQFTPPTNIDQLYLGTALRQLAKLCPDKDAVKRWEEGLKMMQKFEVCISFAPKIPRISITVPGRLLVKEGEAFLIEKKGKTKVWLILFTDIILITQRRRGTVLMCLEPAIPLDSLRINDFNCSPETEFQLMSIEGSLIRMLRVPSAQDKKYWMASLKERALGSFRRKHGERISRVNNLPKLDDQDQTTHTSSSSKENESRHTNLLSNSGPSHPRGGGGERGGGGGQRKLTDLPDLGLGLAATPADELDWRRANTKRRSFNLFGGKGKGEKKKKDKKGDLPSPSGQDSSTIGDPDLTLYSVPPETLREWRKSLDVVLQHPAGRVLFHRHLAMEHSLENMQFCKEVDHFKTLPDNKLEKEAHAIAAKYVGEGTPKALNIDSSVVKKVEAQLKSPHRAMFDEARQTAYELMAQDSFRRFKTSTDFVRASQRDVSPPTS